MARRRMQQNMKNESCPKYFLCPHGVNIKNSESEKRWTKNTTNQD